jgi:hypothetical protein
VTDVAHRLQQIRERIRAACERSGRDPASVTLVGASKRQPPEHLQAAAAAGLAVFGENRVQEAQAHAELLSNGVEWHLIGPLQSNKAGIAAELFDVVQSVDRLKIARVLDREAESLGKVLPCLVEINVGDEDSKHGFSLGGLTAAVEKILGYRHLDLRGLMAIPPYDPDPEQSRRWFCRLRQLRGELAASLGERLRWGADGEQGWLSMGMSDDFEVAIEEGATHVRVGTALFGPRPESA